MRYAPLLLAVTACNFDRVSTSPAAKKTAAEALVKCGSLCPPNSTPMVVSTPDSDMLSTHWSCGCLGHPVTPAPSGEPRE